MRILKILLITLVSLFFLGCGLVLLIILGQGDNFFKNELYGDTFKYKGLEFEHLQEVPMAFQKDTILADVWYRTLNVDGDNKRIIRLYNGKDTFVFPLSNSVNNYTDITFYSIKTGYKRILWIEDNFGTTIFDIDKHKTIKVKNPEKKLTEIAPTGAPIGIKKLLTTKKMLRILGKNSTNDFHILDSLTLKQ